MESKKNRGLVLFLDGWCLSEGLLFGTQLLGELESREPIVGSEGEDVWVLLIGLVHLESCWLVTLRRGGTDDQAKFTVLCEFSIL